MAWSKEPPTEEGWYWHWDSELKIMGCRRFFKHKGELLVIFWHNDGPGAVNPAIDTWYWLGPIEIPEPPEEKK
jgi:hypothetical protein